jgi:hypothetical protein
MDMLTDADKKRAWRNALILLVGVTAILVLFVNVRTVEQVVWAMVAFTAMGAFAGYARGLGNYGTEDYRRNALGFAAAATVSCAFFIAFEVWHTRTFITYGCVTAAFSGWRLLIHLRNHTRLFVEDRTRRP